MIEKLAVTAAACAALASVPATAAGQGSIGVGGEACPALVTWTFSQPLSSVDAAGTVRVDYEPQQCANAGATVYSSGQVVPWPGNGKPFTRRARTHTFEWSGTCTMATLRPLDDGGIAYWPSGWITNGTVAYLSGEWVPYGTLRAVYEVHTLAGDPQIVAGANAASSVSADPVCRAKLIGAVAWTLPWLV
jgi:hypothetical protein